LGIYAKFKMQYEKYKNYGNNENDLPVKRTFSFLSEISEKPSKNLKRDDNFSFQVDLLSLFGSTINFNCFILFLCYHLIEFWSQSSLLFEFCLLNLHNYISAYYLLQNKKNLFEYRTQIIFFISIYLTTFENH
jgi:hypothetical protein